MEHKQQPQSPSLQVQKAAIAIAHAVGYGLVHNLDETIERNHTRGWADENLYVFRLRTDGEVREAWNLFLRRRTPTSLTGREDT